MGGRSHWYRVQRPRMELSTVLWDWRWVGRPAGVRANGQASSDGSLGAVYGRECCQSISQAVLSVARRRSRPNDAPGQ